MAIKAAEVKKLRDMTGTGMMECKRALVEANGDMDKAVEALRIAGAAKAAKRADRQAANGAVAQRGNSVIELLCETDFVAKNTDFIALADEIVAVADSEQPSDAIALAELDLPSGKSVSQAVADAASVIGEKIELGRYAHLAGDVEVYMHQRSADLPPAVGVLVSYTGDATQAKTVAMQIAAMRPRYLTRDDVPADLVDNERRIAEATAIEEGKPERALPNIIEGRVNGYFKETVLLEQPSVQESKKSVAKVLEENDTSVLGFARIEIGQA
jgi:elongation factor Ts